jgi:hypothetical protein
MSHPKKRFWGVRRKKKLPALGHNFASCVNFTKMKRAVDENRFLDVAGSRADTIADDVGEITCKRWFHSLFGISTRICVLIWTLLSKQLGRQARPVHLCTMPKRQAVCEIS